MTRVLFTLVVLFTTAACFAADPPKPSDRSAAEANLRKTKEAAETAEKELTWLSRALWLASLKSGDPNLKTVKDAFDRALTGPAKDLNTDLEGMRKAVDAKSEKEIPKLASRLRDNLKLLKPDEQAAEVEKLAEKIRTLPVGLVSDKVDDKFQVSADLLVTKPKEAEVRFKVYLAAMQDNVSRLQTAQMQLEDAAGVAGRSGKMFTDLAARLEKVIPYAGPFNKALTAEWMNVGKLAKAYNGFAADAKSVAEEAKRVAEVEQKRHDNLKAAIKTVFGFVE